MSLNGGLVIKHLEQNKVNVTALAITQTKRLNDSLSPSHSKTLQQEKQNICVVARESAKAKPFPRLCHRPGRRLPPCSLLPQKPCDIRFSDMNDRV